MTTSEISIKELVERIKNNEYSENWGVGFDSSKDKTIFEEFYWFKEINQVIIRYETKRWKIIVQRIFHTDFIRETKLRTNIDTVLNILFKLKEHNIPLYDVYQTTINYYTYNDHHC